MRAFETWHNCTGWLGRTWQSLFPFIFSQHLGLLLCQRMGQTCWDTGWAGAERSSAGRWPEFKSRTNSQVTEGASINHIHLVLDLLFVEHLFFNSCGSLSQLLSSFSGLNSFSVYQCDFGCLTSVYSSVI
jgi:hypothetical protein